METILNRVEITNPEDELEINGINQLNGEPMRLTNIATNVEGPRYRKRTESPYLRDILFLKGDCNIVKTDAEGVDHEVFQIILENEANGNWILMTDIELEENFVEMDN